MTSRMPPAIYALALAAFAVGTTEFVIVGLIPSMAGDLGVSVATAGLLVSLYAAAITIGTPVVSALAGAVPRRTLLLGAMAIFTLCNVAAAIAPSYATLLAARVGMGVVHGVFFGIGAAVASSLVDESRSGRAQAVMIGGLTVSMVIGVPLGTWLGQLFSWRVPFLVVTGLAAVSLVGLWRFLPAAIPHDRPAGFLAQLSLLGDRKLAVLYAITALGFGSSFVVFTFLSPLLTGVTGFSEAGVGGALVLFGAATVIGNFGGGRLVDAVGARTAMIVILAGLVAALGLIPLAFRMRRR